MSEFEHAATTAISNLSNAAFRTIAPQLQRVDDNVQRQRWQQLRGNPQQRAQFIQQMGERSGAATPEQLQQLERRYIEDMTRRFGDA